jgi:hypothetical protein
MYKVMLVEQTDKMGEFRTLYPIVGDPLTNDDLRKHGWVGHRLTPAVWRGPLFIKEADPSEPTSASVVELAFFACRDMVVEQLKQGLTVRPWRVSEPFLNAFTAVLNCYGHTWVTLNHAYILAAGYMRKPIPIAEWQRRKMDGSPTEVIAHDLINQKVDFDTKSIRIHMNNECRVQLMTMMGVRT